MVQDGLYRVEDDIIPRDFSWSRAIWKNKQNITTTIG